LRATFAHKTASNETGYRHLPTRDRACRTNAKQNTHKAVHKTKGLSLSNFLTPKVVSKPDPVTGYYNPFPTFPFTGTLRPVYPLSETRQIPDRIVKPDYAKDGIPRSEQSPIVRNKLKVLNKEEQDAMRKVCRLAREVLDIAAAAAKPGVTTDYIDEIVHKACIERDVRTVSILQTIACSNVQPTSHTPRH
jgi:methionyl aminopeptidase